MAEPTKAELQSKLAETEAKLKEEAARRKVAEEELANASKSNSAETSKSVIDLKSFQDLQQAYKKIETEKNNLSQELDDIVSKYESSPDLEKKVADAVKKLSDKPKALLFKKISLALGEVRRIPKNGWNDFFRYKYSQEGDILDGIRPILSDVGLMVWTTIKKDERKPVTYFSKGKEQGQKTITKVDVEFIIGCADTGEVLISVYSGEGEDESDKGLYKAYTGATKYFLTKNFLISSGDILQDNEPSDPEADTARHRERSQQNAQNGSNSRQSQNRNQREGQREEFKNQPPQSDQKAEQEKAEMLKIWTQLAGSEEGFEGFYNKQTKQKGASHAAILDFLNKSLADKQKEARQNQQKGGETPQDAPPINQPPKKQEQQEQPSGTLDVDNMTPEEYLSYVEENLPFPLTDSERQQILNDAREGNRNHRK